MQAKYEKTKQENQEGDNYLKSIVCEIQVRFYINMPKARTLLVFSCVQMWHLPEKESTNSRSHLSP